MMAPSFHPPRLLLLCPCKISPGDTDKFASYRPNLFQNRSPPSLILLSPHFVAKLSHAPARRVHLRQPVLFREVDITQSFPLSPRFRRSKLLRQPLPLFVKPVYSSRLCCPGWRHQRPRRIVFPLPARLARSRGKYRVKYPV